MSLSTADRKVINEAAAIINRETDANGGSLRVTGLGTFSRKVKPARTARNPQTGAPVAVPERSVLAFKASTTTRRDQ